MGEVRHLKNNKARYTTIYHPHQGEHIVTNYWNGECNFENAVAQVAEDRARYEEEKQRRFEEEYQRYIEYHGQFERFHSFRTNREFPDQHKLVFIVEKDESQHLEDLPEFLPGLNPSSSHLIYHSTPVHEIENGDQTVAFTSGGWGVFNPTDLYFPLPKSMVGFVSWIRLFNKEFEVIDFFEAKEFKADFRCYALDKQGLLSGGNPGPFHPLSEYHNKLKGCGFNVYDFQPKPDDFDEDETDSRKALNKDWRRLMNAQQRKTFNAYVEFIKSYISSG